MSYKVRQVVNPSKQRLSRVGFMREIVARVITIQQWEKQHNRLFPIPRKETK